MEYDISTELDRYVEAEKKVERQKSVRNKSITERILNAFPELIEM